MCTREHGAIGLEISRTNGAEHTEQPNCHHSYPDDTTTNTVVGWGSNEVISMRSFSVPPRLSPTSFSLTVFVCFHIPLPSQRCPVVLQTDVNSQQRVIAGRIFCDTFCWLLFSAKSSRRMGDWWKAMEHRSTEQWCKRTDRTWKHVRVRDRLNPNTAQHVRVQSSSPQSQSGH